MENRVWIPIRIGYPTKQFTKDGRLLTLNGNANGKLTIRFVAKQFESADTLAADFRIADNQGVVWETTSTFTANFFLKYLCDLNITKGLIILDENLSNRWDSSRKAFMKAFDENLILEGATVCLDWSTGSPPFAVEDQLLYLGMDHNHVTFDLAYQRDVLEGKLAVRMRSPNLGKLVRESYEVGFNIEAHYTLLHNTAYPYAPDSNDYYDNKLPNPLIFRKTELTDEPQAGVQLLDRA